MQIIWFSLIFIIITASCAADAKKPMKPDAPEIQITSVRCVDGQTVR